jgi:hypothetical protein
MGPTSYFLQYSTFLKNSRIKKEVAKGRSPNTVYGIYIYIIYDIYMP